MFTVFSLLCGEESQHLNDKLRKYLQSTAQKKDILSIYKDLLQSNKRQIPKDKEKIGITEKYMNASKTQKDVLLHFSY